MFDNCILREEDNFECPGRTEENCRICPYYFEGDLFTSILGFIVRVFSIAGLIIAGIITLPFLLIAIIIEEIFD